MRVLLALLAFVLFSPRVLAQTPQAGDPVRIETFAGELIEGTLLDKLPTGYLVRANYGGAAELTRTIRYEDVRSIRVAGPEAPAPAPTAPPGGESPPATAPSPPGAAPGPALPPDTTPRAAAPADKKKKGERFPTFMTMGYVVGVYDRIQDTAIGRANTDGGQQPDDAFALILTVDGSPAPHLAIGGDFLIDSTRTYLLRPGEQGCGFYIQEATGSTCVEFPEGADYWTTTIMGTLWAKAWVGSATRRLWAGAGFNLAQIQTSYLYADSESAGYGDGEDVATSVSIGVGGEYVHPIGTRGRGVVVGAQFAMGSPVYGESIPDLFYDGFTWSRGEVGHAVNPWRLSIAVGIPFPSAKRGP